MAKPKKPVYLPLDEEPAAVSPAPPAGPAPSSPSTTSTPALARKAPDPESEARAPALRGRPKTGRGVREGGAKPFPLFLHPEGHKALKLYCVESGQRMHDVVLRWLEDGARRAGFRHPLAVQPTPPSPGAQLDIEDAIRTSPRKG